MCVSCVCVHVCRHVLHEGKQTEKQVHICLKRMATLSEVVNLAKSFCRPYIKGSTLKRKNLFPMEFGVLESKQDVTKIVTLVKLMKIYLVYSPLLKLFE